MYPIFSRSKERENQFISKNFVFVLYIYINPREVDKIKTLLPSFNIKIITILTYKLLIQNDIILMDE
jgi:hypothetical protein